MIKKKFNKVKIVLIFQPCIQVLHFIETHITMGKRRLLVTSYTPNK